LSIVEARFRSKGILEAAWYHENKNVTCVAVDAINTLLAPLTFREGRNFVRKTSNFETDPPSDIHDATSASDSHITYDGTSPIVFVALYRQYILEKKSNATSVLDNSLSRAMTSSMEPDDNYRGSVLAFMGDFTGMRRMSLPSLPRTQEEATSFRVSELRFSLEIGSNCRDFKGDNLSQRLHVQVR